MKQKQELNNRILLIEDNKDYSEMLAAILGISGYEVRSAGDGAKGLKTAKEYCPNVIICDIGLPGIDGYEVVRRIRKDKRLKNVFMIALTGYAARSDITAAKDAGFDLHMAKPADIAVLKRILSERR